MGWNVAATLKAETLPLQALDMAAWDAGGDLTGLTHHSDHGSNYMAMVYTDRVVELGAVPSTGTVGDSYDNALAEAINNRPATTTSFERRPSAPMPAMIWPSAMDAPPWPFWQSVEQAASFWPTVRQFAIKRHVESAGLASRAWLSATSRVCRRAC